MGMQATPPTAFAEYRLLWSLGRGGMGEVFLGHDVLLDRKVAIKFINSTPDNTELREQYLNEARVGARLQAPNVVTIHRIGEIDGLPYIVSEYVPGRNLAQLPRPMPWPRVLSLALDLSKGLAVAHERGILHRDIKPSNAILADDGTVKLLDFGLAKVIEPPGAGSNPGLRALPLGVTSPGERAPADSAVAITDEWAPLPPGAAPAPGEAPAAARPPVVSVRHSAIKLPALPSGIKGTPQYMAPEILLGAPATKASDVYSMGVLLFELCVGVTPRGDMPLELLRELVTQSDLPGLVRFAPTVDLRLAEIVDRCLRRSPAERYASAVELRDALAQMQQQLAILRPIEGNPYRGLRPYGAEHRALMTGRQAEIGSLLGLLRGESCVTLVGTAGSGKTSLCQAGLLPLIAQGAMGDSVRWRTIALMPSSAPIQTLASGLSAGLSVPAAELHAQLSEHPQRLARLLSAQVGSGEGVLLFIDQLEELLDCQPLSEAAQFAAAVSSLVGYSPTLRLLLAVRSDRWSQVVQSGLFGATPLGPVYALSALPRERHRAAVIEPASLLGGQFEPESLVDELLSAIVDGEGSIPLLQLTLAALWEARSDSRITADTLRAVGGAQGPIVRHAELTIASMPARQRSIARRLLLRLHDADGRALRPKVAELIEGEDDARQVLIRLEQARLVHTTHTAEEPVCRIAHPELGRWWRTLQRWLEEQRPLLESQLQVSLAAQRWVRQGRPAGLLLRRGQLALAQGLFRSLVRSGEREALTALERSFIETSQAALRRRGYAAAGLALVGMLVVGLLLAQHRARGKPMLLAGQPLLAESRAYLAAAQMQHAELVHALEESLMLQMSGQQDAVAAHLAAGAEHGKRGRRSYFRAAQAAEAALRRNPGIAAPQELMVDILTGHAELAEQEQDLTVLEDLLLRLDLYDPSGEHRRLLHAPGRLSVQELPPGATVRAIRYARSNGRWLQQEEKLLGQAPIAGVRLPPGLYLLRTATPDAAAAPELAHLQRAIFIRPSTSVIVRAQQPARPTPASP